MEFFKKIFRTSTYAYTQVILYIFAIGMVVAKLWNSVNLFHFLNVESYVLFSILFLSVIVGILQIISGAKRHDKAEMLAGFLPILIIIPFAAIVGVFINVGIYFNKIGVKRESSSVNSNGVE